MLRKKAVCASEVPLLSSRAQTARDRNLDTSQTAVTHARSCKCVSEIQSAFDVCRTGHVGNNCGVCCPYYVTGVARGVHVINYKVVVVQLVFERCLN